MLAEDEPDLTLLTWRVLRDVRLWIAVPRTRRRHLGGSFSADRIRAADALLQRSPDLADALAVLGLLRTAPGRLRAERLAGALRTLTAFLSDSGCLIASVGTAEAAARLLESDPALANLAGRQTRHAGLAARSEVWFERAQTLAGQQRNRRELIWALLGRGVLLRGIGRIAEAKVCFEAAARGAIGNRRTRLAGMAHHELLAMAAEEGAIEAGLHHAQLALVNYPIQHPALPNLVHDLVVLLLRANLYYEALRILRSAIPHIERPAVKALALSTKARAAGSLRRPAEFEQARVAALDMLPLAKEFAGAIHVNIAEGARGLGLIPDARQALTVAIAIARQREDAPAEQAARKLEDEIAAGIPAPPRNDSPSSTALSLVRRMLSRLDQRARPKRGVVAIDVEASGRIERPLAS